MIRSSYRQRRKRDDMLTESAKLFREDFATSETEYTLTRLLHAGDAKLRTTIHRDGYARQSFAACEVWTQSGWTTIVRVAGTSTLIKDLPSYSRVVDDGAKRSAAELLATSLEADALKVLV